MPAVLKPTFEEQLWWIKKSSEFEFRSLCFFCMNFHSTFAGVFKPVKLLISWTSWQNLSYLLWGSICLLLMVWNEILQEIIVWSLFFMILFLYMFNMKWIINFTVFLIWKFSNFQILMFLTKTSLMILTTNHNHSSWNVTLRLLVWIYFFPW